MCLQKTMLLTQANLLCETAANRSQEQARMLASISHSTMCDVCLPIDGEVAYKARNSCTRTPERLDSHHTAPCQDPKTGCKSHTSSSSQTFKTITLCRSIMRNNDKIHTDVSRKAAEMAG